MALITCKDCKKEYSTDAKCCPHCGAKKPSSGPGAGAAILFVIGAVVVIGAMGDNVPKSNDPADYALSACRGFIKRNAHDSDSVEFEKNYPRGVKMANGNYSISLMFRAKNGFGAMRRNAAECIMSYRNGEWTLEKLSMAE